MLVGLAGYAGAGKDTAAQCLLRRGWRQDAFAAPLKAMALDSNPIVGRTYRGGREIVSLRSLVEVVRWEEAKKESDVRRYLQNLGAAVRTHLGEDVWVRALEQRREYGEDLVITDVRYPNEAEFVLRGTTREGWQSLRRSALIWIDRPGVGPVNDHPSDQGLVRPLCTHEIMNDGSPEDLWAQIVSVVGC